MGSLENGGSGSGKAGRAQWIQLTVWNQNKAENRPASGKIDVKRMKAKCQLCLVISNPLLFNPILHSHWALTVPASLYVWFLLSILATKERKCYHRLKFRIWNLRDEGVCQDLSAGGLEIRNQLSLPVKSTLINHTSPPPTRTIKKNKKTNRLDLLTEWILVIEKGDGAQIPLCYWTSARGRQIDKTWQQIHGKKGNMC